MKTAEEIFYEVAVPILTEIESLSKEDILENIKTAEKELPGFLKIFTESINKGREEALKEVAERTHIMSDGVFRINKQSILKLIDKLK